MARPALNQHPACYDALWTLRQSGNTMMEELPDPTSSHPWYIPRMPPVPGVAVYAHRALSQAGRESPRALAFLRGHETLR